MTLKLTESQPAGSVAEPAADGTFEVVLIAPGQGSSGYYSEEVIREHAATAWPKGTHVYLDHLKEGETRTPEKLLGALVEDTRIDPATGEAKNRFKPLTKHREWIEEVRPYVGLSISASGDGRMDTIDGRETLVVESLAPHITNTVDIVSYAGRGGKFLESYLEEANQVAHEVASSTQHETSGGTVKGNDTMTTEEKLDKLTSVVESLVAKIDAQETAKVEEADASTKFEADREAVLKAAKAVADSDATASVKEELFEGIKAGNYDVDAALDRAKKFREEVLASVGAVSLTEAGASATAGASTVTEALPSGW